MSSKHIIAAFIILVSVASCVRKQPVVTPAVKPSAGKGETQPLVTLVITPTHIDENIDSCWIYLKYNTLTLPADSVVYDDSMEVAMMDGAYRAEFDSLKRGDYFIAARGYDAPLVSVVKGGAGFTVPVYPKLDTLPKKYNLGLAVYDVNTGR